MTNLINLLENFCDDYNISSQKRVVNDGYGLYINSKGIDVAFNSHSWGHSEQLLDVLYADGSCEKLSLEEVEKLILA